MRLIDADAMEKTILDFWGCDPAYCMDLNGWDPAVADVCTLERLKSAPTVDAVLVCRCAECRKCATDECYFFAHGDWGMSGPDWDFFCADGEKREGRRCSDA